jgi:AcrR family transcriptional regulator
MATQPAPTPEPRIPLSRERILEAALELADEGGIESLTMRKLGQALGFEAMSLYNHVANKDDVLDGILDLVLHESELPATDDAWDISIRRSAISVYDALRRHPWAVNLLMSPDRVRAGRLRYMDRLLEVLREAGFSPGTTYHAYHALDAHIIGFSLWAAGHTIKKDDLPGLAEDFMRRFPLDDYPDLLDHFHQHMVEGEHQNVNAFEFSLDLILDGLRKIHDAG